MAKGMIEVECPCCRAALKIDPETSSVITHQAVVKPPPIEDLGAAVQALKGQAAKREAIFQKSFAEQKIHQAVLDKKFDELFKKAKEDPDSGPPKRDFDFD